MSKFLLRTTMVKVLMVFYASVAISALVVEDGTEGHSGVAESTMCRLCMFLMQVQSRLFGGPKAWGFHEEIRLTLHNQSCLTFIPQIIITTSCMACFFFSRTIVLSQSPDIVNERDICKLLYVNILLQTKQNLCPAAIILAGP